MSDRHTSEQLIEIVETLNHYHDSKMQERHGIDEMIDRLTPWAYQHQGYVESIWFRGECWWDSENDDRDYITDEDGDSDEHVPLLDHLKAKYNWEAAEMWANIYPVQKWRPAE